MSKYDYRDPATDPAYCDALAPDLDEPDGPYCLWCGDPLVGVEQPYAPYCSSLCVAQAAADSEDQS